MRFIRFEDAGGVGLGVEANGVLRGLNESDAHFPGPLSELVGQGAEAFAKAGERLAAGATIDREKAKILPPFPRPPKIICVGLNYRDHAKELGFEPPNYPALFARFATTLIGHGAPLLRPKVSDQFDYEAELAVVVGRGGRRISKEDALDHVAGYSIFNDVTVRDYQNKGAQWTVGKNFDGSGPFGPAFVTSDELPPGAKGLRIQTRLNGEILQDGNTDDMVFDVATILAIISEAISLESGDVIITGTPAGVGTSRKPQVYMKASDRVEIEIEGIGVLANIVVDE